LVRRARSVVDAALPTATVVVPTDRLAGGREAVESVVAGSPPLVERMLGLIRVIAADAAVLVAEMLMPRGLGKRVAAVDLGHGTEADVEVLGPPPHRLVDGLGLVAQIDRVDPERDPLNLVERPFEQVNGGAGGVVLEAASEHPPRVQAGGAEGEHAVA